MELDLCSPGPPGYRGSKPILSSYFRSSGEPDTRRPESMGRTDTRASARQRVGAPWPRGYAGCGWGDPGGSQNVSRLDPRSGVQGRERRRRTGGREHAARVLVYSRIVHPRPLSWNDPHSTDDHLVAGRCVSIESPERCSWEKYGSGPEPSGSMRNRPRSKRVNDATSRSFPRGPTDPLGSGRPLPLPHALGPRGSR